MLHSRAFGHYFSITSSSCDSFSSSLNIVGSFLRLFYFLAPQDVLDSFHVFHASHLESATSTSPHLLHRRVSLKAKRHVCQVCLLLPESHCFQALQTVRTRKCMCANPYISYTHTNVSLCNPAERMFILTSTIPIHHHVGSSGLLPLVICHLPPQAWALGVHHRHNCSVALYQYHVFRIVKPYPTGKELSQLYLCTVPFAFSFAGSTHSQSYVSQYCPRLPFSEVVSHISDSVRGFCDILHFILRSPDLLGDFLTGIPQGSLFLLL